MPATIPRFSVRRLNPFCRVLGMLPHKRDDYLHQRGAVSRSEEHTSELQSQSNLVCRLLLEKKKKYSYSRFHPVRYTTVYMMICFLTRTIANYGVQEDCSEAISGQEVFATLLCNSTCNRML